MASKIADGLRHLREPIDGLVNWRDNPRTGDVEAVMRSYETFGQLKPIVARRVKARDGTERGEVIAGNHQLMAARRLGWDEIAVVWVQDDDTTAASYAIVDNRVSDVGTYNNKLLQSAIARFSHSSELLTAASCKSLVATETEAQEEFENIKSTKSLRESKEQYDNRQTRTFMAELPVDVHDWTQEKLRQKRMAMCGATAVQALIEIAKDALGE